MKTVKRAMAALLWCVVSVGCMAEEPQPAEPEKIQGDEKIMQSIDVIDQSSTALIVDVAEDELHFFKEFKDIIFKCRSDGPCAFLFDDLIVYFGPYYRFHRRDPRDTVYWPTEFDENNYEKYIGKKLEVYCKKTRNQDVSFVMKESGIKKYESKIYPACSTKSDKKYFIKFVD